MPAAAHRRRSGLQAAIVALLVATTLVVPHRNADAAPGQLTPVTGFGSNPGNLLMFEWIPADLPPNAPVVVVLHGCFASAALYDDETGWTMLADRWNVALVFPQQSAANEPTNCFSWWKTEDHTRGQGEALSVKQMVDWMHANRGTDPKRVYVMGHSGGGLFTSVMLATYPDVFRAGAIVAGGPYKCGDEGPVQIGPHESKPFLRGGECVDGSVDRSAEEWGDLARGGFPGHRGPKPRVSIWHGSADTMVTPKNLRELVEQWTNYHGIDRTPDISDTVKGYPHQVFEDGAGNALVESYELTGRGHGWSIDPGTAEDQCNGRLPSADYDICVAYHAGRWFHLDKRARGPRG
ncbi:MAG: extracellular catalytic domain type 1 short-chain-length polyhydroxyalkanoate depolymerase [Actinomycetota bacterium]